jgi:hypothetical protein
MESPPGRQDLIFENAWGKDVSSFRKQVVNIWVRHRGPRGPEAEERLKQVVYVVKNDRGDVVGLSTAFKSYVKQLRNHFFVFRLSVIPEYRVPGLTSKLLVLTRDFLESIHLAETADVPIGLITLVENEALKQHRNEAIWPASKMVYIGNSKEGHHIRVYYFAGARIVP